MTVAAEVTALTDRAFAALNAANDFREHTRIVWESFRKWVAAGNPVTAGNEATGTTVTEEDLVALSQRYAKEYIATFVFQRYLSTFESYFFDLMRVLLAQNPFRLSRKQIDLATVLACPDREAVILAIIDKELNELKYARVRD